MGHCVQLVEVMMLLLVGAVLEVETAAVAVVVVTELQVPGVAYIDGTSGVVFGGAVFIMVMVVEGVVEGAVDPITVVVVTTGGAFVVVVLTIEVAVVLIVTHSDKQVSSGVGSWNS